MLREEGSGTREVLLEAMPEAMAPFRPVMVFDNPEAFKRAVQQCGCITCLSRMAVDREIAAGLLAVLPSPWLDLRRAYRILVHRQRHRSLLLRASLRRCESMTKPGAAPEKQGLADTARAVSPRPAGAALPPTAPPGSRSGRPPG